MIQSLIVGIAVVIGAGIVAQWLAWRLRLPSILLLLVFGFILGPASGILQPDTLFGDLLFPIISLAVGVILFEGGLGLKISEVQRVSKVVRNIISVGALVTWVIAAVAAYTILHLPLSLAILLAAVLIVSGPTVILPLLRDIRPKGQTGTVLRWEGILIDPVGAILAMLVFEALLAANLQEATSNSLLLLARIMLVGSLLGWLVARLLAILLRRYLIPDHLQNAVTLMLVVGVFALSNALAPESGLLATTVMGVVLANQRDLTLKHIVEFKEDLGVVITSSLFILLVSRLHLNELQSLGWSVLLFLAVLILARPVAVWLSTRRSPLERREKIFLSWMAPRGVVAAAVVSIFALELEHQGFHEAERLIPITFMVISGTVLIYGLSAGPLARRLGLAEANPQGVLFVGAHAWARQLATILQNNGYRSVLVDINPLNVWESRQAGLEAYEGNILYEEVVEELDLGGIGRLLALTSNDEVNALACQHMAEIFGKANVYQLNTGNSAPQSPSWAVGRRLFGHDIDFNTLDDYFDRGWQPWQTRLDGTLDYQRLVKECADTLLPLFAIGPNGNLHILTVDGGRTPQAGGQLIALMAPECELRISEYLLQPQANSGNGD